MKWPRAKVDSSSAKSYWLYKTFSFTWSVSAAVNGSCILFAPAVNVNFIAQSVNRDPPRDEVLEF